MKEGSGLKEFSVLCVSMWLLALHDAQNTYLNAHLAGFQLHVAVVWLPALHHAQNTYPNAHLAGFQFHVAGVWLPALHDAQNTYPNAHLAGFQFHVAGVWLPALHNAQVQGRAAAGHAADCFLCAGDPHSLQGEGSVQAVGWSGLMWLILDNTVKDELSLSKGWAGKWGGWATFVVLLFFCKAFAWMSVLWWW